MASTMKARPTTYKGIQMRSRLEAGFARWLDLFASPWEYEPQCFASDWGQYLPDFVVHQASVRGLPATLYVECKPLLPDGEAELAMRDKYCDAAEIILESDPDAAFVLATKDHGAYLYDSARGDLFVAWWFSAPAGRLGILTADDVDLCPAPWPDGYWKAGS